MPHVVHILGDDSTEPEPTEIDTSIVPELAWCLDPYAPVPPEFQGERVEIIAPELPVQEQKETP